LDKIIMTLLDSKTYKNDLIKAVNNGDFTLLNNKSIFITGATGLICSTIIDELMILNKLYDAQITIYAAGRNEDKVHRRFGSGVIFVQYDALELANLNKVDFIIHGAGNASPELYTNQPVETMLSNIIGVNNLLCYCKTHNSSKMVYISSSEVYGTKSSAEPFCESDYGLIDQENIRNSYSESKRASEMLCRSYAREYGVSVTIARPGHVYGPSASKNDKRISSYFAYNAAKGINLEMLSSGLQKRSYCYSVDCAAAILAILLRGLHGEAYNIGTEEVISIREMATILAVAGNVILTAKNPTEDEKRAFNPMDNSSLKTDKIQSIGYKQTFSPEEGLSHTVRIIKEILLVD